ncbi:MAG TPA: hypothetical protein DDW29_10830 [Gammaproteobacteria bacterium]|nr:hypothetical protein [Gammaproteobacteria bacterium]
MPDAMVAPSTAEISQGKVFCISFNLLEGKALLIHEFYSDTSLSLYEELFQRVYLNTAVNIAFSSTSMVISILAVLVFFQK